MEAVRNDDMIITQIAHLDSAEVQQCSFAAKILMVRWNQWLIRIFY